MLQRIVDYYKRHKRPILVTGGIISVAYLTSHYAKQKFLQFQDRNAKARAAKENLRRRFDQNQLDAMYSVLALVEVIRDQIETRFNHEELVGRIANLKTRNLADPENPEEAKQPVVTKLQLWEDLKIMTFTRALGSIYVVELLGILGHIQMNLVGRLIYIESVVGEQPAYDAMGKTGNDVSSLNDLMEATSTPAKVSYDNERLYLSFSWWFINRGWKDVIKIVQEVVNETVGSIPLKQKFNYNELVLLFATLRSEIDQKLFMDPEVILDLLLPSDSKGEREVLRACGALGIDVSSEQESINEGLRILLDETKDFIECSDFSLVRSKAMDAMLEFMLVDLKDKLCPSSDGSDSLASSPRIIEMPLNEDIPSQPLAKLLPVLAQLSYPVLRSNSNPYLRVIT
ncbi:peroxin, variant 2 [Entomophthora muscae]|uniref:Peroxin, variant 2 n=1 Tax=Entomophthora muscae TaxID=34485 RepID=A0ACC2TA40_9FUNG|nr:peroxin, variant 2 [Entomophthora muscae]